MIRTAAVILVPFAILSAPTERDAAHAQAIPPSVEATKANVVRVEAAGRTGFGFVVGILERKLLMATAFHTLDSPDVQNVTICFAPQDLDCADGRIVHIGDPIGSQPRLDLAILSVDYPDGLGWHPYVEATARAEEPVWSIGRYNDWYIPESPGHVVAVDSSARLVRYRELAVAEGVSGAPIVSPRGIVAMHVESAGGGEEARGVELSAIRERVEGPTGGTWILTGRATCDSASRVSRQLAGRFVLLHFDARSPQPGLEAASVLHCLGARVGSAPVWNGEPWPGDRIRYRSGDLRLARALQSALAPYVRLETELGDPSADAEVWVR